MKRLTHSFQTTSPPDRHTYMTWGSFGCSQYTQNMEHGSSHPNKVLPLKLQRHFQQKMSTYSSTTWNEKCLNCKSISLSKHLVTVSSHIVSPLSKQRDGPHDLTTHHTVMSHTLQFVRPTSPWLVASNQPTVHLGPAIPLFAQGLSKYRVLLLHLVCLFKQFRADHTQLGM